MAIARAILSAPQLILFDEPLNGLDENHREQILGHLEKLQQKISLPILYVTHNMEELMRLADRVLVLEQGSLLALKNISDILSDLTLPFSQHQQAGVVISAKVHSYDEINHLIELDLGDNQFLSVTSPSTNHLADEEMLEDSPMSDNFEEPIYDFLKKNALSLDNHKEIKKHCESIGITYLCTPFSYKAAVELMELDICGFKIGSGEMTDIPSLLKIADLGKPMILSTGMSTLDEIDATYNALKDKCNNLFLLETNFLFQKIKK